MDDRRQRVAAALGNVPEGVEVARRAGAGKEVFVLVNHTKTPQRITLPAPMRRVMANGEQVTGVELPGRGVEVLRK